MIRLARIITETSEALQMVTNACEFLTKLTIGTGGTRSRANAGVRNAGLTLWRIYGEWAYECNSQ